MCCRVLLFHEYSAKKNMRPVHTYIRMDKATAKAITKGGI